VVTPTLVALARWAILFPPVIRLPGR